MTDEFQQKVKYTMQDLDFVQKGIDVVCKTYIRKKALVKSISTGDFMEIKPHAVTKKLMGFLENEGLIVEFHDVEKRKGVKQIAGISVNVSPISQNSYAAGFFFTFMIGGDTKEAMKQDFEDKKYKITKEFNKHGIPTDKICLVSVGECLENYGKCVV